MHAYQFSHRSFRIFRFFELRFALSIIYYRLFRTIFHFAWEFQKAGFNCISNTRLSVSLHFINKKKVENTETRLTFSRRKLTTCAWFRLAAIWSGVLPLQSTRVILQTAGSLLTKYWTIGIAPCSHAMWNAVCLSSFWGIMDTKRHNEMHPGKRTCPYNALFYLSFWQSNAFERPNTKAVEWYNRRLNQCHMTPFSVKPLTLSCLNQVLTVLTAKKQVKSWTCKLQLLVNLTKN